MIDQKYRVIIRIIEKGALGYIVKIPLTKRDFCITIPHDQIPDPPKDYNPTRLIGWVNIEAETRDDITVEKIEWAPKLTDL